LATQYNKSMVSETSIVNQALGFLGANPITSLNDDSTSAQLMRDNYPFIRDAVLTEAAWTFATDRLAGTTADMDAWGKKYKHGLPLDWMQVLRVYRDVSNDHRLLKSIGWTREGNFILTNEATVYMWGIKRITDTSLFSPAFVQCLSTRIAADLCMAITESVKQQATLYQLYDIKLKEAINADGVQGANEMIQSNTLLDARLWSD
jgi:hypothetical protein